MGEPVKIADLAERMIRLAGMEVRDEAHPEGDIAIEFTGLRPGEKLFEELWVADCNAFGTRHPKIMKALEPAPDGALLRQVMAGLDAMLRAEDEAGVRDLVLDIAGADRLQCPANRSGP